MDRNTFIVTVFCLIDDWLKEQPKRRKRGPQPTLRDSEVLTIEVVGAFLGIDTDKGLFTYFRRHYGEWFPALQRVHRTTFVRQSANLWAVKAQLWQDLLSQIAMDPLLSLVDSFPVPVCRFGRAYRCRRLPGVAAFGQDETVKQTFYGLRAHLRVCWPGVIVGFELAPANVHDLSIAEELLEGVQGWVLGDRSYWSPRRAEQWRVQGVHLLAPRQTRHPALKHWPHSLVQKRRRIETVIAQLVGRFHAKMVWARDRWHLCSRWLRRVLSHTIAVLLCQHVGLPPLRFAELLAD
jgi:hypothetical protein